MGNVNQTQKQERRATSSKYRIVERVIVYCTLPVFILLALIIGAAWTQFKVTAPFLLFFLEGCFVLAVISGLVGFVIRSQQKRLIELEQYRCLAALELEQYKHHIYQYHPDSAGNYAAYFDRERRTFLQPERVNVIRPVPQTLIYSPTTVNEEQQQPLTHAHVVRTMPKPAGSMNGHQEPSSSRPPSAEPTSASSLTAG
jgi:hypothetical protein